MKKQLLAYSVIATLYLLITPAVAENNHKHQGSDAMGIMNKLPTEGGQSAFAAIAEIVELLNNNPHTDWSTVNISKLREHLVDMNELTLNSVAKQETVGDIVTFRVSGEGRTLKAIQAMVIAHGEELNKLKTWDVSSEITENGALLIVQGNNKNEVLRIKALGFYGMMAIGSHHQQHHYNMARGVLMNH